MRVAVFGAAGRLGRKVLSLLIRSEGIDYLLAGDSDTRGLSELHASLGHLGVAVRYLEAEDRRSFGERMSACDAVISCLGGRGTDEFPLAREAVERGCLYLSSGADPGVFLRREEESPGRSGSTAVMGLGWSPGLSGLLAAHLGARFRRLDAISVYWCADAREMNSPGGAEELLRAFGGRCPGYQEGRRRMVRAGSWEEWVDFPPRSMAVSVSHVRGPETVTLPSLFPEMLRVELKGGLAQERLRIAIHTLSWAYWSHEGVLRDLLLHGAVLALRRADPVDGEAPGSALLVRARGMGKDGVVDMSVGATGSRLQATAGLLVGAMKLLSMRTVDPGILAPEEAMGLEEALPILRMSGVRFWGETS